ncbi:hypothetical protein BH09BAC1_BH09BAC1_21180 [soil metagenome]
MKSCIFCAMLLSLCMSCGHRELRKSQADITLSGVNLSLINRYGLFYSQEITNAQYRYFLNDLKTQGRTEDFEKYRPDWEHWDEKYPVQLSDYYHTDHFLHPAYDNSPITNIPHEGATAFCIWLTNYIRDQTKVNLPNAKAMLPTEDDWITMAGAFVDNVYPWYELRPYDEKGVLFCNVALEFPTLNKGDSTQNYRRWRGLAPSVYMRPNRVGLYHIIGNAAEMTCEGYIKGGSWTNTYAECALNKRQTFDLPHPEVGFRIIVLKDGSIYPNEPYSKNRRKEDCPSNKN